MIRCANISSIIIAVRKFLSQKISVSALLGCLVLIHLHDYHAEKGTHIATFILVGFFLLLMAGGIFNRKEAPAASESSGRLVDVLRRVLAVSVCGSCMVFHLLPQYHDPASLLYFSLVVTAAIWVVIALPGGSFRGALCAAACLFIVFLTTPQMYQGLPFFHERNGVFQTAAVSSFVLFALCAALNLSSRAIVTVAIVSGLTLRIIAIGQWEINGFVRDMLPLIESAASTVLDGRNPYRLYFLTHDVALTYMPMMWISYLPACLAGIDIRWMNILFALLCCVLIYRWGAPAFVGVSLSSVKSFLKSILPGKTRPLLLLAAIIFSLQSEIFWNSVFGEPPAYWFWLVIFLTCVAGRLYLPAAVLLGIVLATRHFGIIFIPFFIVWLKVAGFSWKDVLAKILITGAVASFLVVPWMMLNPDSFLYGTFEWLVTYGPAYRSAWDFQIGFQSYFYQAGKESMLFIVQGGLFGAVLALTLLALLLAGRGGRRERAETVLWIGCGFAYLVFVFFGNMVWKSFLVSAFLFPFLAFAPAADFAAPRFLPRRKVVKWVLIVFLALVNITSVFFVFTAFSGWKDRSDIVAFAAKSKAHLKAGDLLIDYSYFNAWHLLQGSAFASAGPMPGVAFSILPRNHEMSAFKRIAVFDGYSAHDMDREFADLVDGYRLVHEEKEGRSSFYIFQSPAPFSEAWRMSRDFDSIVSAEFVSSSPPTIIGSKFENRYIFSGMDPWIWVETYKCLAGGLGYPSVFARLVPGKTLSLTIRQPVAGDVWLMTTADDRIFIRPLGSLELEVRAGKLAKTIEHPGERGIFSWYLGKLPAGEINLRIEGKERAMGSLCIDLVVCR